MTASIKDHSPVSEIYTEALIEQKVVTREEADRVAEALSSSLLAPDEPFFRKSGRPFLNMAV
jgi:2-oxoglutarate dehydrogenase complex dehydrogenase (E1) component-like enzyme